MNERMVTALGAAAALLVLMALTFQGGGAPPATRPTSTETGPNGYAALARWLEAEGVPVHSLRERVDSLREGDLDVPAGGNLLITTMPHRYRLRRTESTHLWYWIAEGNTMLVMAALDDTPDWSLQTDSTTFLNDLERLTGLTFGYPDDAAQQGPIGRSARTTPVTLAGFSEHPLMEDVGILQGVTDAQAQLWVPQREDAGLEQAVLQLARETGKGPPAMWQVRYGKGYVIVSALGSALSNRVIGEADNARFVANLLRYHVRQGGAVIFDDMHQGLSTLYDAEAFFDDPRLGASLLFLLGLWALYVLGSNSRLAAVREVEPTPSQGDFVRGVGGFLARKLSRPEAGRLMLAAWFDDLRRRGAIPAGSGPPWQALAGLSTVEPEQLARLRVYHDALGRGEDVDLRDVHNTIEELRRTLG